MFGRWFFVCGVCCLAPGQADDPPVLIEFPIGDVEIRHVEGPRGMILTVEHRQVGVQGRQFYLGDGEHAVRFAASLQGIQTPGGVRKAARIMLDNPAVLTVPPSAAQPWAEQSGEIYIRVPNLKLVVGPPLSLLQRAEARPLQLSSGRMSPRVVRDEAGDVRQLKLSDMPLSAADLEEIAGLATLEALVLRNTNVVDEDLFLLARCPQLRALNVSNTDVSDAGIDAILQMKQLKSLCLGQVCVTKQGIERLRAANRERDKRQQPMLRWGYSQRQEQAP